MEETAERILEILQDYHCDFPATKYEMSVEHITKWANQFEDDAAFVLSELLHFLPQIYISKSKAIELLKQRLIDFQNLYKYQTMNEFIMNTHFIDVQKEEKSQNLPYRKRNFVFGNFINYHGSYLEGYRRFIRCKSRLWYEFPATDIYTRWL